ncbi:hypothetical protein ABKN59_007572 [Abortiporus biennis]
MLPPQLHCHDVTPTHLLQILPRRDGGRRNRRRPVAISCKQSNRNNVQDPTSSSRMFHPETPRFWANCNRELQSGNGKITEKFRRIIDEESDNNKGNLELYDKTLSQMVPIYFNEKHTTDSVYQENHLCHSYAYDCRGEDCQLSILQQYSEFVTVICLQRYHIDRTFGNRRLRAKVDTDLGAV